MSEKNWPQMRDELLSDLNERLNTREKIDAERRKVNRRIEHLKQAIELLTPLITRKRKTCAHNGKLKLANPQ